MTCHFAADLGGFFELSTVVGTTAVQPGAGPKSPAYI
jgi:hypothetical protein